MFDSFIDDFWCGYTKEQFSEALYETLVNYLIKNGIINPADFREYEKEYFGKYLQAIIDRDRKKVEEKCKRTELEI